MPHHAVDEANDPFRALSRRFSGDPKLFLPHVERAIADLESSRSLEELARARVGDEMARHFVEDWLTNAWPDQQPIEPKLRQRLLVGFRRALERRHAMEFRTETHDGPFDVTVGEGTPIEVVIRTPA